jgi:hypothetical protein
MKNILAILSILLIMSCSEQEENPQKTLKEQLTGKWKNLSMTVQMNTFRNTDTTAYFVVKEDQWVDEMGIKPIITTLNDNGSYTSEYFNMNGEKFREASGNWFVVEDSMVFIEKGLRTAYQALVNDTIARFRATIDWDRDGKTDDLYEGVQIKIE